MGVLGRRDLEARASLTHQGMSGVGGSMTPPHSSFALCTLPDLLSLELSPLSGVVAPMIDG